ncbi:FG-GAP repeat domain-containing protein [Maribacter sp. CXY002]|uniref:FG-GAP repeat domain-containing protein n=1 Tax=Maribacter luteocoastalis TaxID=3407671 RepID=UPI003B673FBB
MENKKKEITLYENYCSRCHIAPEIKDLPKNIWENNVLPAMAARMGIINQENHPYYNLPFNEQSIIIQKGIFPNQPIINLEDWELLKSYIIGLAPDSLNTISYPYTSKKISQFKENLMYLDENISSNITYLGYNRKDENILLGSNRGTLTSYDLKKNKYNPFGNFMSPISDVRIVNDTTYITTMGMLLPSEISSGNLIFHDGKGRERLLSSLHRPVHTLIMDLNNDGINEYVVSEFGDLGGQLSLWFKNDKGELTRHNLLNQPGIIKVAAIDMNKDGNKDLVVLSSQGDEGITILYQDTPLKFSSNKVIRFSPVYGTSWFEVIDYDQDGDMDLITVHGDNADESYTQKPYHGMRIHLNDGSNNFKETYFHPLNGATRVIAKDFDLDEDIDIALLSTFPDYEKKPNYTFVYLENKDSKLNNFEVFTLNNALTNRWFLMDSADIDNDGDQDIILSSFDQVFTPVPEGLAQQWKENNGDLLILENVLK